MPPAHRTTVLLAAFAWFGCTGGQSGTETPSGSGMRGGQGGSGAIGSKVEGGNGSQMTEVINTLAGSGKLCACALAGRSALLRATLLELDGCELRARVEEALALPGARSLRAAAGDEIAARRAVGGCTEGLALAPGDEVLLVYAEAATAGAKGEALLASWGDQLVFGSELGQPITLPRADQRMLLDAEACSQSFGEGQRAPRMAPKLPPACTEP